MLEKFLSELGWSGAELARRLGVSYKTVSNWRTSGRVPEYALAYLRLKVWQRGGEDL